MDTRSSRRPLMAGVAFAICGTTALAVDAAAVHLLAWHYASGPDGLLSLGAPLSGLGAATSGAILVAATLAWALGGVRPARVAVPALALAALGLGVDPLAQCISPYYDTRVQARMDEVERAVLERHERTRERQLDELERRFERPQRVVGLAGPFFHLEGGICARLEDADLWVPFAEFVRNHLIGERLEVEVAREACRTFTPGGGSGLAIADRAVDEEGLVFGDVPVRAYLAGVLLNPLFNTRECRTRHYEELAAVFESPQRVAGVHGIALHLESGLCVQVWRADQREAFEAFAREHLVGQHVRLEIPQHSAHAYVPGASCGILEPPAQRVDAFEVPYAPVPALVRLDGELLNLRFAHVGYRSELVPSAEAKR
jgi:hypothetical protein